MDNFWEFVVITGKTILGGGIFIKLIDTSNLEQGMIIKNYKELCKLVGVEPTTGNAKNSQLNEINRYCDLVKDEDKNSYTVLEVYDNPLPASAANNSKYLQYIQDILLFYLGNNQERVTYKSRNDILQILGMINNKYIECKSNKEELVNLNSEMNEWEINEFYKRCDAKLYSIIESSLKSLKKRLLIDYSDAYKIFYTNESGEKKCRIASSFEQSYILKIKHDVMVSMGYGNEYQIYMDYDRKVKYYNLVNETVKEEMHWEGVYQCYKIIIDPENAIKAVDSDIEKYKLNTVFKETIDKQAEDKYNNNIERYPSSYIDMQHLLSETLIKITQKKFDSFKGSNLK